MPTTKIDDASGRPAEGAVPAEVKAASIASKIASSCAKS